MTRPIKFRAWLENTKVPGSNEGMVFGYDKESYAEFINKIIIRFPRIEAPIRKQKGVYTSKGYVYRLHHFFNLSWLGKMHIMQFIGRQDCNGVDMYVGDIVENGLSGTWVIQPLENGSFSLLGICKQYKDRNFDISALNQNAKVIGSIHSNPELLK